MTKLLQKAFEQARLLPDDQQDAAGAALLDYLDHMQMVRLTDEQVAEVRRRLAGPEAGTLSLEEVRRRFQTRGE
ncbi:MAG: hypothetical protein ACXW3N_13350 [Rhodoplanes sp.]|jgi:hypothetical protein|nr:hypothetical protein [Rhodoplanes sp.]